MPDTEIEEKIEEVIRQFFSEPISLPIVRHKISEALANLCSVLAEKIEKELNSKVKIGEGYSRSMGSGYYLHCFDFYVPEYGIYIGVLLKEYSGELAFMDVIISGMGLEYIESEARNILSYGKERTIEFIWHSAFSLNPDKIILSNNLGDKMELNEANYTVDDWNKIVETIDDIIHSELLTELYHHLDKKILDNYGFVPDEYELDSDTYWIYALKNNKEYRILNPNPIEYTKFGSVTYSFKRWIFNFAEKYDLEEIV